MCLNSFKVLSISFGFLKTGKKYLNDKAERYLCDTFYQSFFHAMKTEHFVLDLLV